MSEATAASVQAASAETSPGEPITVAAKWQGAVTDGAGFVAIPMTLLRLQSQYGLTPTDMMVLINLLAHWWDPKKAVFPRSTTIANRLGVDKRTIQRCTRKLEGKGLLTKEKLADGKRAYNFEVLARRLARDVPAAYRLQGSETFHG